MRIGWFILGFIFGTFLGNWILNFIVGRIKTALHIG